MRRTVAMGYAPYETLGSEEAGDPVCGVDFCDGCGDCLHCYGDDLCPDGQHHWVRYIETPNKAQEWNRNLEGHHQ